MLLMTVVQIGEMGRTKGMVGVHRRGCTATQRLIVPEGAFGHTDLLREASRGADLNGSNI